MKKIVIIPNVNKEGVLEVTAKVSELLTKNGAQVYIDEKYGRCYEKYSLSYSSFPSETELIIVIGGDGSVIDASVLAVQFDIPVLGINLGNFGYLSEVEPTSIDVLNKIFKNEYKIEEKMLLCAKKLSVDGEKFAPRLAVNDVIISHESHLGIADFMLINNSGENVRYRGDGIILATPAGSTAYSLSAGGPVVDHAINSILVTPICPHSFFNRSVIFNENTVLTIKNTGKSPLKISMDGRLFDILDVAEQCVVYRSESKFKVLTFDDNNMLSTLFGKMKKMENV